MQQAIDGKRIQITCVDLFLLPEYSGSQPNRCEGKRDQAVGGRLMDLRGRRFGQSRRTEQAETGDAGTGLKERATRRLEHDLLLSGYAAEWLARSHKHQTCHPLEDFVRQIGLARVPFQTKSTLSVNPKSYDRMAGTRTERGSRLGRSTASQPQGAPLQMRQLVRRGRRRSRAGEAT
jgi:hypothetical protein